MQGKVEEIVPVFMENDFGEIMNLWLKSNMEAHSFISKDYWLFRFEEVKCMLPQAELFVWREEGKILGFLICERQVDEETGEKEYLMKWTKEEEK